MENRERSSTLVPPYFRNLRRVRRDIQGLGLDDPDPSILHSFVLALPQDSHRPSRDFVTVRLLGFRGGVVDISI